MLSFTLVHRTKAEKGGHMCKNSAHARVSVSVCAFVFVYASEKKKGEQIQLEQKKGGYFQPQCVALNNIIHPKGPAGLVFPTCSNPLSPQKNPRNIVLLMSSLQSSLLKTETRTFPQTACFQPYDSVRLRISRLTRCASVLALFLFISCSHMKMPRPCVLCWTTRGICLCGVY